MQIRLLNSTDAHQLRELYRLATAATEGLIREPDEITLQYIEKNLSVTRKRGDCARLSGR
jgi:hypothetical protein